MTQEDYKFYQSCLIVIKLSYSHSNDRFPVANSNKKEWPVYLVTLSPELFSGFGCVSVQ